MKLKERMWELHKSALVTSRSLRFRFCYSHLDWNDRNNKDNFDPVSSYERREVWPIYKAVQYFVSPYAAAEHA